MQFPHVAPSLSLRPWRAVPTRLDESDGLSPINGFQKRTTGQEFSVASIAHLHLSLRPSFPLSAREKSICMRPNCSGLWGSLPTYKMSQPQRCLDRGSGWHQTGGTMFNPPDQMAWDSDQRVLWCPLRQKQWDVRTFARATLHRIK